MPVSELEGGPLPEGDYPTIWQRFNDAAEKYPDHIAVSCLHQRADLYGVRSTPAECPEYAQSPWLRWTYPDVTASVARFAQNLQRRGLAPGAPFFSFLMNGIEYPLCVWASMRQGCCYAPINPRNLVNQPEVQYMVDTVIGQAAEVPPVFVAADAGIAGQIDSLQLPPNAIKVVLGDALVPGWTPFATLMEPSPEAAESSPPNGTHPANWRVDSCVMFTSCLWEHPKKSIFIEQRLRSTDHITPEGRICISVPNNHGACYYWFLPIAVQGAMVVFPGPAFDPVATIKAFYLEKCNNTILVPTMVHALAAARESLGLQLTDLDVVSMGGSMVSQENIDEITQDLGAKRVESLWGMTEFVFIGGGAMSKAVKRGNDISCGSPPLGTKVRVCAPGEREPLPTQEVAGELHVSAPTLCEYYIARKSDDHYRDSDGRMWFNTGDQAMIAEGQVFIVGRYKDMLIRGGENIAPAAIESAISREPRLRTAELQIVGAPDTIAGQVPVVVVKEPMAPETFALLKETVKNQMGTQYIPTEVFQLQDIGLQEWPRTSVGKYQKAKVAEAVKKFVDNRENPSALETAPVIDNPSGLELAIKQIWARTAGIEPDMLSVDRPVMEFADSITLMRVRDRIAKETGRTISLADMIKSGTVAKQSELLLSQTVPAKVSDASAVAQRSGPPSADDIVHLKELFDATREVIVQTLEPFGLSWTDVQDVTPTYEFQEVISRRESFQSWTPTVAVLPHGLNVAQTEAAIRSCLRTHPMFSSFVVRQSEDTLLHVIMTQTDAILKKMITYGGKAATLDNVVATSRSRSQQYTAAAPGPLSHFTIFDVEETGSAALVASVSHHIADGSYAQIFLDDLNLVLGGLEPSQHTSFKAWCDSYHARRKSPEAQAAIEWQLQHLKGLETHRKALWPAPGDDRHEHLNADGANDKYTHNFACPDILLLRQAHGDLAAPSILKAANALVLASRTQHTHALFANVLAARRSFPFVPAGEEQRLEHEASDVAGAVWSNVTNVVPVARDEAVLDFLRRVQADQDAVATHAHAPTHAVMAGLGPAGAETWQDVQAAQHFNWLGSSLGLDDGAATSYAHMRLLAMSLKVDIGLVAYCGLGGGAGDTVLLALRGNGLDGPGMQRFAEDMERVVKWMCAEANWTRPVGEALRECVG